MLDTDLLLREHAGPARVAATVAIALGSLTVAGWVFGIHAWTSIIPDAVEMKMNTGLGLVTAGAGLLILSDPASRRLDGVARGLCVALVVLGLLTLAEYTFGWKLGIDETFVRDDSSAYNVFRGRMAPMSAVAFAALGCAIFALQQRSGIARFGAGCVIAIGSISLLGYLWDAVEITTDRWLPPVALNTAAAFVVLGIGILLVPAGPRTDTQRPIAAWSAVEAKILTGFVIVLSLLLAGGTYTYRANAQFANAMGWVAHTQEVRTSLASLYGSLAGSEVALRDYLLTADDSHRAEYRLMADEVDRHLHELGGLTADNPAQQSDLQTLKLVVAARLDALRRVLEAYDDFGLPAARAVMSRGRSPLSTQNVRMFTDRMDSREEHLLVGRQAGTEHERRAMLVSLLVTIAVASAVFTVLFRSIHTEMLARRDAESEVKRTADELLEANRFLDSLIENLPAMIVVKDAKTLEFVRQNRAFEEFLGLSRDGSLGKGARDLFSAEEADLIIASDRAAIDGGKLVNIPEQTILTRTLGLRTFHTMKVPIPDGQGRPQFLLAISTDITERKLAEQAIHELNAALETKAAQLQETNKELESFSYSVSHDLRAPLRAIDGFALMIEEDYIDGLDAEGRRYLSVIRENAKRMGGLIDDLLAFSRLGRSPLLNREVNVDALVREVAAELIGEHTVGAQVQIQALPPARGDPGLLRQVWTNLLSNALKYSGKTGRARIEVSGRLSSVESLYSIRDNGVGFDMAYADKLFGVFQRLHRADEFEGTGVGLAIVHRVVTRHGGRIWAEGKFNEGATFSFALPRGGLDD